MNSSSLEDSLRDLLSDDEADEMPCEADRHSAEAKPAAVSLQVSVATPAAATPRRMFRTDSSLSNMSCATDDATPPNSARPVRALGARKGFEGNFKWGSLPDELVVQVAMRLAWPMVGQVCMSVCRRWHHTLRGDVLWNFFSRQHWTPEACTHRHLEELDHTGGWMAFRDWHRRRVWRVYGELQTGWDWLLARLSQASLSGEEQARCRQVTRKLIKQRWWQLYDSVGLVVQEQVEATRVSLLADLPPHPHGEAEEVLGRLAGAWRGVRAWMTCVEAALEPLNDQIERENRRREWGGGGCGKLAHTPPLRALAAIAFRDGVLLWSGARARRLSHAVSALAAQEAVELPDAQLELLLSLQGLLDELDVEDDLTGGRSRGRARLRKLFLQPLRSIQSHRSFHARSGKVRMFGGESDLIYGPGSEGEEADLDY